MGPTCCLQNSSRAISFHFLRPYYLLCLKKKKKAQCTYATQSQGSNNKPMWETKTLIHTKQTAQTKQWGLSSCRARPPTLNHFLFIFLFIILTSLSQVSLSNFPSLFFFSFAELPLHSHISSVPHLNTCHSSSFIIHYSPLNFFLSSFIFQFFFWKKNSLPAPFIALIWKVTKANKTWLSLLPSPQNAAKLSCRCFNLLLVLFPFRHCQCWGSLQILQLECHLRRHLSARRSPTGSSLHLHTCTHMTHLYRFL